MTKMERHPAYWTYDERAAAEGIGRLYYFAPTDAAPGPYLEQRHVEAILDVAQDGTLAGVELIDVNMPIPPATPSPATQREPSEGEIEAVEAASGGINALLGLLQLVAGRPDINQDVRDALTKGWRIDEARAALRQLRRGE